MYSPEHFRQRDAQQLADLIAKHPFGTLITLDNSVPNANHLPFVCEQDSAGTSVLRGHMARANTQWQQLASGRTALVIFQGPHGYVSPGWYGTFGVPTWNYAVAHVYGTARVFTETAETEQLLARLTRIFEASQAEPWQPQWSSAQRDKLLDMIVGFEIQIEKIEGKFKLSQNRSPDDRLSVARHLEEAPTPPGDSLAQMMRDALARDR